MAQLDALGGSLVRHPAWAQAPDGRWREPGWLVAGIADADLVRLAREFGQVGVLAWRAGEPVRLRMLMPRPLQADGAMHTDWVAA